MDEMLFVVPLVNGYRSKVRSSVSWELGGRLDFIVWMRYTSLLKIPLSSDGSIDLLHDEVYGDDQW
jgi:hypothetical protein